MTAAFGGGNIWALKKSSGRPDSEHVSAAPLWPCACTTLLHFCSPSCLLCFLRAELVSGFPVPFTHISTSPYTKWTFIIHTIIQDTVLISKLVYPWENAYKGILRRAVQQFEQSFFKWSVGTNVTGHKQNAKMGTKILGRILALHIRICAMGRISLHHEFECEKVSSFIFLLLILIFMPSTLMSYSRGINLVISG